MKLRPYQREAVDSILEAFESSQNVLVVMPTGCGKTQIFLEVAKVLMQAKKKHVLVLAHREELVWQPAERCRSLGIPYAIEMAEMTANVGKCRSAGLDGIDCPHVVIATVQTISREGRLLAFDPSQFCLVITDEAHHAVAQSYRRVYDRFASCLHLGVTATPDRADEVALGRVYDSVAVDLSIKDMIDAGWLVPIEQVYVEAGSISLERVGVVAGDLNQGQLESVMVAERALHEVVVPTLELSDGRPTLVFASGVHHAEMLTALFNRYKPHSAALVVAETDVHTRRNEVANYKEGKRQILVTCSVFTEGFDAPNTAVIAMARPTKSRALYTQIIGRGTRPVPGLVDRLADASPEQRKAAIAKSGKPCVLVIDYVGNAGKHKLIHAADVLGDKYDDSIVARAKDIIMASSRKRQAMTVQEALALAEAERKRQLAEVGRSNVKAKVQYGVRHIDPFTALNIIPRREPSYLKGKPATEAQVAALVRFGIPEHVARSYSMVHASQLIGEMIDRRASDLCTLKQAALLKKFGYADADTYSFAEAKRLIDMIAANGWRRPND